MTREFKPIAPPPGWRFPAGVVVFALGGDFWDKVRALFIHGAKARFPVAHGSRPHMP